MYRQFDEEAGEAGPCAGCAARANAICGTLAAADLAAFGAMGRHRRLARGQTLMWEGDAAACPGLKHSIKSYIGLSADVKIGTVERSIGKAKRVIDKRPK